MALSLRVMKRCRWLLALFVFGCAPTDEQAEVCEQYSACVRARDQLVGQETNLDRFDPGGACWQSEEQGKVCTRACARGLEWERERSAEVPPECRP